MEQSTFATELMDTTVLTAGDFEAVITRKLGDDYYRIEVFRLPRQRLDHTLIYGESASSLPRARKKAGRLMDRMRQRAAGGWEHTEVLR